MMVCHILTCMSILMVGVSLFQKEVSVQAKILYGLRPITIQLQSSFFDNLSKYYAVL